MQVFLSKQCESLTGSLGRGFGYYIRSTKKGNFFAQRSKHSVPPEGHLRFVFACAELAQNNLHVMDIKVDWLELKTALYEANCFVAAQQVGDNYAKKGKVIYDARDILNLKTTFGL